MIRVGRECGGVCGSARESQVQRREVGFLPDRKISHRDYPRTPVIGERPSSGSVRVTMKSGMRDQVEGTLKVAKGAAKQQWGKVTGDPGKKAEGAMERAAGKFQQKTGQIKRDVTRE
jgi:uncharacterized protein YjbJ (UPF0337 family)